MELTTFVFYFLATILVLTSLRVITSRNPVHSVMHLVLAFFSASGIWIILGAEFLAIVLVFAYVGAVMVLFLFVVMMLDINLDRLREGFWQYLPLGAAVALLIAIEIGFQVFQPARSCFLGWRFAIGFLFPLQQSHRRNCFTTF